MRRSFFLSKRKINCFPYRVFQINDDFVVVQLKAFDFVLSAIISTYIQSILVGFSKYKVGEVIIQAR